MNNHITASVEFYFKGEKISASIKLDLDHHMQTTGQLPALYSSLAREINLDLYSYEYETMQAETILFSNATGLAAEHLNERLFDFDAFKITWSETQLLEKLQTIAQNHLAIEDLEQQPDLKKALIEAFHLGKKII